MTFDSEPADDERRIDEAVALVRGWVDVAAEIDAGSTRRDRRRRRRLAALVSNPGAADFTVRLTDEVSRMSLPTRAARRFRALVHSSDLSGLSIADRLTLRVAAAVAPTWPRMVMPLVHRRLRAEADGVILEADDPALAAHLRRRTSQGIGCNVNVLGEAIVGDGEARHRLALVTDRLGRPDVGYVSVKISAVCASISPLAFDDTVARVVARLRPLYRSAVSFDPPKFVNLDMEEYRDLDLTIAAFRELLDDEEFLALDAGIVLQAYLPESLAAARELATWARARRRRGGGRIKIRIVKGANLAMEHAAAEIAGWEAAPYATKADVDANYKAVLDLLASTEFDDAVRIGVASHNLFDVAWALGLRRDQVATGRPQRIEFEMLEGMAPSQSEVVRSATGDLLLYSPIVTRGDFAAALAYLVRRLDENTSSDNFLAHVMHLAVDHVAYEREATKFAESVRARHRVSHDARRRQDRSVAVGRVASPASPGVFVNAPDTDWTSRANRRWIRDVLTSGSPRTVGPVPVVTADDVDLAVAAAVAAQRSWGSIAPDARAGLLARVGDEIEAARGRLLAVMVAEAGKTVSQGDPEVSEAVDFARYYGREAGRLAGVRGANATPRGTIVVAPPWNFPLAIPAGGVLAALAAGNTVILKPAPQTVETARAVVELCWAAGVPNDVVQFLPAADDDAGRRLVTHPDVDAVILTGAHATAEMFQGWRPDLRLHAETSGKNALVISAAADLDEAVADLVRSAFGHAGQKCSAASLAIVEAPLYDDPRFLERIRDAAATLRVGPADDLATDVGPLIEPPGPNLARALTELDHGERWLLRPEQCSDDRRVWTPGVRLGVRPGSWFAGTECFGPVLGIMRADDLDHAIDLQNGTDFGLTAGLHSLDPEEISRWVDRAEAGNLYVNRGITGAIVQRQPFGGWKRSVVGPTAKAGGPNYVATLARWADDGAVDLGAVEAAFVRWWDEVGSVEHDPTHLAAERNVVRYRPLPGRVLVRFGPGATVRQRRLVALAARTAGCELVISDAASEPASTLVARWAELGVVRCRCVGLPIESDLASACHVAGVSIDDADPVGAPEIELPRWLREQSVTITTHRHGRVHRSTADGRHGMGSPTGRVRPHPSG